MSLSEDKIIKQLAEKYGKDKRVIKLIAHSPFKFLKLIIEDPEDWRPLRLRYFGIFGLTKKAKDLYGEMKKKRRTIEPRKK